MKAKILLTGDIVDVRFFEQRGTAMTNVYTEIGTGRTFYEYELEFLKEESFDEEKHWQDVRERAAIAAMQGMLANPTLINDPIIKIEEISVSYADALVKQLRGE